MAARTAEKFGSRTFNRPSDARTLMQRLRDLESQVATFMEPERKAEIGGRLREARKNSGRKLKDIAAAAGVEVRTYEFWETGRGINRPGVEAVAKYLNIDPDTIWEGSQIELQAEQLDRIEKKLDAIQTSLKTLSREQLLATLEQALARQADSQGGSRATKRRTQN